MIKLHLMVGVPGAGKSFFASRQGGRYISRDNIRFALLSPKDDYFAKEDLVFETFVHEINFALATVADKEHIYVDATHLTKQSRMKTLTSISIPEGTELIVEDFETPLDTCLFRNGLRTGRAKVPQSVIKRFFFQKQTPVKEEFEKYGFKKITINKRK